MFGPSLWVKCYRLAAQGAAFSAGLVAAHYATKGIIRVLSQGEKAEAVELQEARDLRILRASREPARASV
jgi:hypothetical protein